MPLSHLEPVQRRTGVILGVRMCAHVGARSTPSPGRPGLLPYWMAWCDGGYQHVRRRRVVESSPPPLRSRGEYLMDKAGASARRFVLAHLRWVSYPHPDRHNSTLSASAYRPQWTHDTPECETGWLGGGVHTLRWVSMGLHHAPWEQPIAESSGRSNASKHCYLRCPWARIEDVPYWKTRYGAWMTD